MKNWKIEMKKQKNKNGQWPLLASVVMLHHLQGRIQGFSLEGLHH